MPLWPSKLPERNWKLVTFSVGCDGVRQPNEVVCALRPATANASPRCAAARKKEMRPCAIIERCPNKAVTFGQRGMGESSPRKAKSGAGGGKGKLKAPPKNILTDAQKKV